MRFIVVLLVLITKGATYSLNSANDGKYQLIT